MPTSSRPALPANLPRRPAPSARPGTPLAPWMKRLGHALNGPGILCLPVATASAAQALATPGTAVPEVSLVIASALLAWVPVAACALAAPLLRDRAMQWRRVALLLALGAGAALVGGVPLVDPSGPAGAGVAGLAAAGAMQACTGGLVIAIGGWLRRQALRAGARRAARGAHA